MFDWKGSIRRRSSEAMGWPIPFGTRAQAFKAWIVFSLPKRVLFLKRIKTEAYFGARASAHTGQRMKFLSTPSVFAFTMILSLIAFTCTAIVFSGTMGNLLTQVYRTSTIRFCSCIWPTTIWFGWIFFFSLTCSCSWASVSQCGFCSQL